MKSLMWQRFSRRRSAVVGLVLFLLLVAFAIFGGLFTRYSYTDTDFLAIGFPPGAATGSALTTPATTSTRRSSTACSGR